MPAQRISSGSPFEGIIGFSRAVRIGHMLAVSGTAPINDQGKTAAVGDLAEQTRVCLRQILDVINVGGGTKEHIIRTRIMLTDILRWREAALSHSEFFGEHKPACTFVQVAGFIDPDWLVEIEADCVLE
jgi:enamine deaminase RidA (YjgF/YER057c/UK114 family)